MKEFFKMFFASLLALFVASVGSFFVFFVFMMALASLKSPAPTVKDGGFLLFNLSGNIQDRPVSTSPEDFIDQAMGREIGANYSLHSITKAIRAAGEDDRIVGIYMNGSIRPSGFGSGYAALKEVREALQDFSKSGKPIWASVVYPSSRDLYLISVADRIFMNPEGMIMDTGMSSSNPYLGAFMKKYGIGVQVTRAGEYKAAAESFVLESMSEPSREATTALIEDVWHEYVTAIEEGADLEAGAYEALLNEHGLITATQALEFGIVDDLVFADKLLDEAHTLVDSEEDGLSFTHTSLSNYVQATIHDDYSKDGYVAVVYAEGSIVVGEGDSGQVGGDRIAREIRKARLDNEVKAMVLRVNSPGGSALASEVIQHEIRLAQERMPVVVSMGNLAASGGYWISAYADKIYAQPNTITGSIGVIGVFFNYKDLADKHGIYFDGVKTTKYADVMTMIRPKTEEEMAMVQNQVDIVYDSFLAKVAEGRGMEIDEVRKIAGGRVWSGADALELGLVDEIGGLGDAISFAASEANLGEVPAIKEYPKATNFFDDIIKELSKQNAQASVSALQPLVDVYSELVQYASQFNDPMGVYAILPYSTNID